jgi:hypothetical protein
MVMPGKVPWDGQAYRDGQALGWSGLGMVMPGMMSRDGQALSEA